jgi:hypothetical protein
MLYNRMRRKDAKFANKPGLSNKSATLRASRLGGEFDLLCTNAK